MNLLTPLLLLLTAGYLLFLYTMYRGFKRVSRQLPMPSHTGEPPFISVIVPARNEAKTIQACLASIFAGTYPPHRFEVLVVNDLSTDDTCAQVEAFSRTLKPEDRQRLRLLHMPENLLRTRAHKKRAIQKGIQSARGSWIVTTDADCILPPDWLHTLSQYFQEGTHMVSGPTAFLHRTYTERMMALEFLGLVSIGAGAIGAGKPILCNGANLAYRKDTFHRVGGFRNIDHLTSGDDELLMQKIAHHFPGSVAFCAHPEALVWTQPPRSLREFLEQRKRWASKGAHYPDKKLVMLNTGLYLFFLTLGITSVLSLAIPGLLPYVAGAWGAKMFGEYLFLKTGAEHFGLSHLLRTFLPAQLFHVPYIMYAGLAGFLFPYEWKDREIVR